MHRSRNPHVESQSRNLLLISGSIILLRAELLFDYYYYDSAKVDFDSMYLKKKTVINIEILQNRILTKESD